MKKYSMFIICFLSLVMVMCDDVFEENISKDTVQIISPVDGVTAPAGSTIFLWRLLDGARGYRLTIVSPDFANAAQLVADTLIYNDTMAVKPIYRIKLGGGSYQWKISALNHGYESKELLLSLYIEEPQKENKP